MAIRRALLAFAPLTLAFALFVACSNQGEGERCDTQGENNGNSECQSGLRCTPAAELSGSQVDRCCPEVRESATVDICKPITGSASPPGVVDGGRDAQGDGAVDSGRDAGPDAQDGGDAEPDTGADASVDAPDEGG